MTSRKLLLSALALLIASPVFALHDAPIVDPASEQEFPWAELEMGPLPSAPVASFVLDPGHGGEDLGAVVAGRREKDIALAIARKLKERLEKRTGIPARLTRDSDTFIPLDARVKDCREGVGFVSLHLNQVRSKKLEGITVYAFGKSPYKSYKRRRAKHRVPPLAAPTKEQAEASREFAGSIVRSLRAQGFKVEPPVRAGFYVLKNPDVPSVLIELGYLSNPDEAARLSDPAYQDKLADALATSLQNFTVEAGSADGRTARRPSASSGGR